MIQHKPYKTTPESRQSPLEKSSILKSRIVVFFFFTLFSYRSEPTETENYYS